MEDLERNQQILNELEDENIMEESSAFSEEKQEERKPGFDVKEIMSWVLTFVAAVAVALLLKNFVIINATVPTGSMENTILPGDDIIGLRLAYTTKDPERGDIIIFNFPDDETQKYVKRIIGLPGDTVYITEGQVYINGSDEPLEEDYLKEDWTVATGPFYFEVPEDSYFVMGDNRNNSYDSRYWNNTFVTREEIIGKAWFTYFPFNRMGLLN